MRQKEKIKVEWTDIIILTLISSFLTGFISYYIYIKSIRGSKIEFKQIFKLLPADERLVLEKLVKRGEVYQSEISKELGKLKAQRVIKRLE